MGRKNWEQYIGKTFERWTILNVDKSDKKHVKFLCQCSCKNNTIKLVDANCLLTGSSKSCGCLSREKSSQRMKENNPHPINKNKFVWNDEKNCYIVYDNNNNSFLIDKESKEKVEKYYFRVEKLGYVATFTNHRRLCLHHYLLFGEQKKGIKVYHANRIKTDCRLQNLRIANSAQNSVNRSLDKRNKTGVSGVNKIKNENKWRVTLNFEKVKYDLGTFSDFTKAVQARLQAEKDILGEFAPQKHLFKEYGIE